MKVRRVVGNSMVPTLRHGQLILVKNKKYRSGDVVVAKQDSREVVKRLLFKDTKISLYGDNPNSARYENVAKGDIVGVVIWPKIKT